MKFALDFGFNLHDSTTKLYWTLLNIALNCTIIDNWASYQLSCARNSTKILITRFFLFFSVLKSPKKYWRDWFTNWTSSLAAWTVVLNFNYTLQLLKKPLQKINLKNLILNLVVGFLRSYLTWKIIGKKLILG
jgi:hypothetical protein